MKRIIFDVPRWHAYLHRDARGLEIARDRDDPVRKLEDELFDRLYSGDSERLPKHQQDPKLRAWADALHTACEQLPAFGRLASECRGEPIAAGTAVETLMAELRPQLPQELEKPRTGGQDPSGAPWDRHARRRRQLWRNCARRWRGSLA